MSKKRLDWAKENERCGRNVSWVARYYMVESYLRYSRGNVVYTIQSGKHPNCTDIDEYMGWKAHSTEKLVNNKELFTVKKERDGWTCQELAHEKLVTPKVYYDVSKSDSAEKAREPTVYCDDDPFGEG